MGKIDANFIRVLVKFNAVKLPDEEALQQNNSATIFECLLSRGSEPFQVKLRAAGPASVVNWMLQGREGEV